MTTPLARLAGLGLQLPAVVPPVAAYVPARRAGQFVFTSGQLPMVDGAMPAVGRVGAAGSGAAVSPEQAYDLARACALNALAAVDALVGLDAVASIVKVVGFVASDPSFTGQPGVVDGASRLLASVFDGGHARSAVGVVALPLDAPVEIELIAELRP